MQLRVAPMLLMADREHAASRTQALTTDLNVVDTASLVPSVNSHPAMILDLVRSRMLMSGAPTLPSLSALPHQIAAPHSIPHQAGLSDALFQMQLTRLQQSRAPIGAAPIDQYAHIIEDYIRRRRQHQYLAALLLYREDPMNR